MWKKIKLENKSRKGWYYYYKEKGKAGRYYKEKPKGFKGSQTAYKRLIQTSYTEKRNITKLRNELNTEVKRRKKAERTVAKQQEIIDKLIRKVDKLEKKPVTKTKSVESIIKKGIYETEVNLEQLMKKDLKKDIAKKMSKKGETKLLMQNLNKTKKRYQYEIEFYDGKGNLIMRAYTVGKNPEEVAQDIKREMNIGQEIKRGNYQDDLMKGYNTYTSGYGTVKKIKIKLKYVKG